MKKIALAAFSATAMLALSACGDAAEEAPAEETTVIETAPIEPLAEDTMATDAAATDAAADAAAGADALRIRLAVPTRRRLALPNKSANIAKSRPPELARKPFRSGSSSFAAPHRRKIPVRRARGAV